MISNPLAILLLERRIRHAYCHLLRTQNIERKYRILLAGQLLNLVCRIFKTSNFCLVRIVH